MNFESVEKIANAVLYEGFLLYPYRKSSVKNQQRWHFGTLGPKGDADRIHDADAMPGGRQRADSDRRKDPIPSRRDRA